MNSAIDPAGEQVVTVAVGRSTADARPVGLGCRIADELVLVAASAISGGAAGHCFVSMPGGGAHPARVIPGDEITVDGASPAAARPDVALLDVAGAGWSGLRSGPPRWGVLSSQGGWLDARLAGVDGVEVAVNPLARRGADRWELRASTWPGAAAAAGSCAPLLVGGLLVGIACWDPAPAEPPRAPAEPSRAPAEPPRVTAVPMAAVAAAPALRRAIEQATGRPVQLEPVELTGVVLPWPPAGPPRTPADLLLPEHEVVPFAGRDDLLADLASWCTSQVDLAGLLLTGGTGQGKTRLARQLAGQLQARGWAVGFLSAADLPMLPETISRTALPLLLVVDRAEERADQVRALVSYLAAHPMRCQVRLLLLATTAGGWWETLAGAAPALRAAPVPLPRPGGDAGPEVRRAAEAFAAGLRLVAGQPESPPTGVRAAWLTDPHRPAPAGDEGAGSVLDRHLIALAAVLGADEPAGPSLDDLLVAAEASRWESEAGELGPALSRAWPAALTVAALCPAAGDDEALRAMSYAAPTGGKADWRALADWARRLRPPADPRAEHWGRWEPARVRDHYLAGVLPSVDLGRMLGDLSAAQARVALAGVARVAATDRTVGASLRAAIAGSPATLGAAAAWLAVRTDDTGPALAALHDIAGSEPTEDVCRALLDDMPTAAVLTPTRLLLQRQLVAHRRQALRDGPGGSLPSLAAELVAYAAVLAGCGLAGEASEAAAEAVDSYRTLALGTAATAAAFRPCLAAALRRHAALLAAAGDTPSAVPAAAESAELYRELVTADPDGNLAALTSSLDLVAELSAGSGRVCALAAAVTEHRRLADRRPSWRPRLATALDTAAGAHAEQGDLAAAAATMEQACGVHRRLADQEPGRYLPGYADALERLAGLLLGAGDVSRSTAFAERAVAARRRLVEIDPTQLAALAAATRGLSGWLAAAGRPEQAVAAAEEGVSLARDLVAVERGQLPLLAAALHELALRLAETRRWDSAVAVAVEAADLYRGLTEAAPGGRSPYRQHLVVALNNLAAALGESGAAERSVQVAGEAGKLAATIAGGAGPAAARAAALNNLAVGLGELGQAAGALAAAQEAVEHYRRLGSDEPRREEDFATALNTLSSQLAAARQPQAATAAATAAMDISRRVAARLQDNALPHRAAALHAQAERLAEAGAWEQSLVPADEAADLYRRLRQADDGLYRPELAAISLVRAHGYAALDRTAAAAGAAKEAISLYRTLIVDRPATYLEDLADAIDLLCAQPGDAVGPSALELAAEAVRLRHQFLDRSPVAQLPRLTTALRQLAAQRAALGDLAGALDIAEEAVRRARRIDNPDIAQQEIGLAQQLWSGYLAQAGRDDDSLRAAAGAVAPFRYLAKVRPQQFERRLAGALYDLSDRQWRLGDAGSSTDSAREAVSILRRRRADDARSRRPFAMSLCQLASRLVSSGRDEIEGYETAAAAIAAYEQLADGSAAGRADLARAYYLAAQVSVRGYRQQAYQAARRAAQLYRDVAGTEPGEYDTELRLALETVARHGGRGDPEAKLARAEARRIRRRLRRGGPS